MMLSLSSLLYLLSSPWWTQIGPSRDGFLTGKLRAHLAGPAPLPEPRRTRQPPLFLNFQSNDFRLYFFDPTLELSGQTCYDCHLYDHDQCTSSSSNLTHNKTPVCQHWTTRSCAWGISPPYAIEHGAVYDLSLSTAIILNDYSQHSSDIPVIAC